MNYLLALAGRPYPGGLVESHLSTEVFYELLQEAFGLLPHVTLTLCHTSAESLPRADVILIHDYLAEAEIFLKRAKSTRILTASFMEIAYPVDIPFVFMPETMSTPGSVLLPFPYDATRMRKKEKVPGSILLDHRWPHAERTPFENTDEILAVLEPLAGVRPIAQCVRPTLTRERSFNTFPEPPPKWVSCLPQMPYEQYISATDHFETFLLTHMGSYNGTIVDMIARGTRVIAKEKFVQPSQVALLGVQTYKTADELRELLINPRPSYITPQITPMGEAVRTMDAYIQTALLKRPDCC